MKLPQDKILAGIIGLIFFIVYFASKSLVPTGYADSDEFLVVGTLGGVAHPPGYPLLTATLRPLIELGLNPLRAGQLLAICFQSFSLALLFLAIVDFLCLTFPSSRNKFSIRLAAFFGAGTLGFSAIYWLYGTTIEAMPLTDFLVALTLFAAFRWGRLVMNKSTKTHIYFYLTWIAAGTAVFHMQTAIFLLPALLLLLVGTVKTFKIKYSDKTWLLALSLFFVPLFLSSALLLLFNHNQAAVSWYFPQSIQGLFHHLARQDYAGYFVEEGRARDAYWAGLGSKFITAQPRYFNALAEHFTLPLILFLILSLVWIVFKYPKKITVLSIVVFFLLSGPLFTGYMGFPEYHSQDLEYLSQVGVHHRQLLLSEIALIFIIALGFYQVSIRVINYLPNTMQLFTALLVFGLIAFSNQSVGYQKNNNFIHQYGTAMLNQAAPDSVIFCSSDMACYSLFYLTEVEKQRPDVTILTKNNRYRHYFLAKHSQYSPFSYEENPFFFANLVSYNISKRTVYLTNPDEYYIGYLGLAGDPFYLIPEGYLYKVSTQLPADFDFIPDLSVTNAVIGASISSKDYFMLGFKDYLASLHNLNGSLLINYGHLEEAKDQLELALSLKPDYEEAIAFLSSLPQRKPVLLYNPENALSAEVYLSKAVEAIGQNQLEAGYEFLRKASYLQPENAQIRLELARLYQQGGYTQEAIQELKHGLLFNPNSLEINQLLEDLR